MCACPGQRPAGSCLQEVVVSSLSLTLPCPSDLVASLAAQVMLAALLNTLSQPLHDGGSPLAVRSLRLRRLLMMMVMMMEVVVMGMKLMP